MQKLIDASCEARPIFLPNQVMQEDAHRVHTHTLRPAQLLVDLGWIEGLCLPHLKLIDGVFGDIVAAHQPRLLAVPRLRFLLRPQRGLRQQ